MCQYHKHLSLYLDKLGTKLYHPRWIVIQLHLLYHQGDHSRHLRPTNLLECKTQHKWHLADSMEHRSNLLLVRLRILLMSGNNQRCLLLRMLYPRTRLLLEWKMQSLGLVVRLHSTSWRGILWWEPRLSSIHLGLQPWDPLLSWTSQFSQLDWRSSGRMRQRK